jgi:hypothetical protein
MHAIILVAALYWESGVRSATPTVCFAGTGGTARADRIAQIKEVLKQFEYAANIRFDYKASCTNQPQANGNDFWLEDIRVVIPNTDGSLFAKVKPVPGKGCPMADPGGGGWSNSPAEFTANRPCVFNMHLGSDSFATAGFGDPSGGSAPFINHPLHEFGHALGLSHEHERMDVRKDMVLTFFQKIAGVDATKAQAIYDAGYRNVAWVSDAAVSDLQKIPGFTTVAAATALKNNAQKAEDAGVPIYGGGSTFFMTPYDPMSVMHYTWNETMSFAPGNYANTGLSGFDRLALHILYPEANRVAELLGRRVLRTGETLNLGSQWEAAGADIARMAKNFSWKIDNILASSTSKVSVKMPSAGTFKLNFTYSDFLDRSYAYTGELRVLTPGDFAKKISSRAAATLPLM